MTIDLGASMTDVATSHEKFKQLKNLYSKNKYILDIDLKSGKTLVTIVVMLSSNYKYAGGCEVLTSYKYVRS